MPYQWVDPETFFEHTGSTVYHTYREGGYVASFWYTLDPDHSDLACDGPFDVRELSLEAFPPDERRAISAAVHRGDLETHRRVIQANLNTLEAILAETE